MRRASPALLATAALASCIPAPRGAPPPAAPPPVAPSPAPLAPAPLAADWNDWPRTPGNWFYRRYDGRSSATFGIPDQADLVLSCDGAGRVLVNRPGSARGALTVRTSSLTRTLPVEPLGPAGTAVGATLAATDPLLDAIAFSRGRFTVEQAGAPSLVLPPQAEIGRLIEDCRG